MLAHRISKLAPCRCLACPNSVSMTALLCPSCFHNLGHHLHARSFRRQDLPGLEVASAGAYDGAWRRLIQIAKSQPTGILPSALALWLRALLLHWSEELRPWEAEVVVWVPGHPLRSRLECDLARFTADALADALGLPVSGALLTRPVRHWRDLWQSQKGRRRRARRQAARELFQAPPSQTPMGTRVLLVDDVSTTGSSLLACQRALEGQGAHVVGAFVLADVVGASPVEALMRAE